MEFETAVFEWFRGGAYRDYQDWARSHDFPILSEENWRAKCVAAAILAAAHFEGTPEQAIEEALAALRGVGTR